MLSRRARNLALKEEFLVKYMVPCNLDPFDPESNPKGYVNMGNSLNNVCNDIVIKRMREPDIWDFGEHVQHYPVGHGDPSLRKSMANFLNRNFNPLEKVDPDDLFFMTGLTALLDALSHCLADPGEAFLAPFPIYGRIVTDFEQRSLVDIWPIHLTSQVRKGEEGPFMLSVSRVEEAYEKAIEAGKTIRGLIILNPSNPTGHVLPPSVVLDILHFCKRNDLHVLVDEIYARSVYSGPEFCSVISLPLPDPQKTHFLYGLSKDFGLDGLRVGVVHTRCRPLQRALIELSMFAEVPSPIMDISRRLLDDEDWCNLMWRTNQSRLAEQVARFRARIEDLGLIPINSRAGFFLWVDFTKFVRTFPEECALFQALIQEEKVFLVPGNVFFAQEPGWFRMMFALKQDDMEEGLTRIKRLLSKVKSDRGYLSRYMES